MGVGRRITLNPGSGFRDTWVLTPGLLLFGCGTLTRPGLPICQADQMGACQLEVGLGVGDGPSLRCAPGEWVGSPALGVFWVFVTAALWVRVDRKV